MTVAKPEAADRVAVVTSFLEALRDADLERAGSLLSERVVYQNVGLPTIRGRARTMSAFAALDRVARFEVAVHRSTTTGSVVMNERTDAFLVGRLHIHFWVCGVFEVEDGEITLWRDYFDVADMIKGIVRGYLGILVPAARRSLRAPR